MLQISRTDLCGNFRVFGGGEGREGGRGYLATLEQQTPRRIIESFLSFLLFFLSWEYFVLNGRGGKVRRGGHR